MKVTKDMSVKLTLACIYLSALVLLAADLTAFRWIGWYVAWRGMRPERVPGITATLYVASIFGWICLWALWKLLKNMKAELVFDAVNIRLLRIISWCCAFAALVFLAGGFCYPPFFLIGAAAAFMMLIVRVVKNVFQQAAEMKSELDLTI